MITPATLDEVLASQKYDKRKARRDPRRARFVRAQQLAQILSQQLSCPWVSLARLDLEPELLRSSRRRSPSRIASCPCTSVRSME